MEFVEASDPRLRVSQPEDHLRSLVLGADIGQKHDPTALVVAEALRAGSGRAAVWSYTIRHMERLPLNTSYPDVAERILQVVERVRAQPEPARTRTMAKVAIVVDSTGVGAPVVDILRRGMDTRIATLTEATFTHGDRLTGMIGSPTMSVGKAYLVSRLQALFQTSRIQLPANHPEAAAMTRELMDYEIKVSEDANDKYGAFRTGAHDDLVTALGLAVITDPESRLATARSY
jgi:hypothetical protein